jgi:mono/diheme cytochrome c family protein
MDELLQIIADQKGYPADMVQRSAAARAKADGVSTEDVLRAWAGVGDAPTAAAAPAASQAASDAAADAAVEPEEPVETGPKVEVLAPERAAAEDDVLEPATPEDEAPPEPEPVGALRGVPRWLAVAFVALPSIALLYVLVLPSGPQCGSSGALAIDPATGVAVNCDGSDYGTDASDVFSIGEGLYTNSGCAGCHGAGGGGGVGPAFTNGAVLTTFSACTDHIEWVAIGTQAWPDVTYGDTAKPTGGGGVMPGYQNELSVEEIAAVVLYERVAFGGEDRTAAETGCAVEGEDVAAAAP